MSADIRELDKKYLKLKHIYHETVAKNRVLEVRNQEVTTANISLIRQVDDLNYALSAILNDQPIDEALK